MSKVIENLSLPHVGCVAVFHPVAPSGHTVFATVGWNMGVLLPPLPFLTFHSSTAPELDLSHNKKQKSSPATFYNNYYFRIFRSRQKTPIILQFGT